MSLGLNDLKKRATIASSKKTPESRAVSKMARPWSASELSQPRPKQLTRQTYVDGAFMSAEWANEHAGSFPVFNLETQSALAMLRDLQSDLKDQAREFEQKVKRAAMSPFKIAKSVLRMVQK